MYDVLYPRVCSLGHVGVSFYFIVSGSVIVERMEEDKFTGEQHKQVCQRKLLSIKLPGYMSSPPPPPSLPHPSVVGSYNPKSYFTDEVVFLW